MKNDLQTAFSSAEATLIHRSSVARQILEDLGRLDKIIPVESFNDDDWYIFDTESMQFIELKSGKTWRFAPSVSVGQRAMKGLSAKHLGIWRMA